MRHRRTIFVWALALIALLPAAADAQGNGCNVCYEGAYFHWVEAPTGGDLLFEGIAGTHGIMLGGCEAHTHYWICCQRCNLTDEEKALATRLTSDPGTLLPDVRYAIARYLHETHPDEFDFREGAGGAVLGWEDCAGSYTEIQVAAGG